LLPRASRLFAPLAGVEMWRFTGAAANKPRQIAAETKMEAIMILIGFVVLKDANCGERLCEPQNNFTRKPTLTAPEVTQRLFLLERAFATFDVSPIAKSICRLKASTRTTNTDNSSPTLKRLRDCLPISCRRTGSNT